MTDPRNFVPNPGLQQITDLARRVHDDVKDEAQGMGEALWEVSHGGPARHLTVADIRLLRGRVLIRPLPERESIIVIVDTQKAKDNTLGRGVVMAMGPPALSKSGREVPPGFSVGDTVLFIGQHRSRRVELDEDLISVAQEEVQGVIE